jgi:hypothetical protein
LCPRTAIPTAKWEIGPGNGLFATAVFGEPLPFEKRSWKAGPSAKI